MGGIVFLLSQKGGGSARRDGARVPIANARGDRHRPPVVSTWAPRWVDGLCACPGRPRATNGEREPLHARSEKAGRAPPRTSSLPFTLPLNASGDGPGRARPRPGGIGRRAWRVVGWGWERREGTGGKRLLKKVKARRSARAAGDRSLPLFVLFFFFLVSLALPAAEEPPLLLPQPAV